MWRSVPLLLFLVTLGSCRHHYMVAIGPRRLTRDANQVHENYSEAKPTTSSLHITSDIKYRYATTVVSTRVTNPSNQPGEAAFSVTLPETAFISDFLMVVDGTVYKAYVKDKAEAKSIYQGAVEAGRFAGHAALNARDSNEFTVSVNLEAHGQVTFNMTYEELLARSLGQYSNVINIYTQQVVDDMSVIVNIEEPTAIVDLAISELEMSNESSKQKRNYYSKIEDKSPNHKQIIWTPTPEEQSIINVFGLSGQFIVKYDVDREDSSQQILISDGYFVHFFAPDDLPKLPKHVVFVLDFSDSMRGRKLRQLKEAMNQILSDLTPNDYFSIVLFHSWIEVWSPSSMYMTGIQSRRRRRSRIWKRGTLDSKFVVKATPENIQEARSFMKQYSDFRSTNIMGGLRTGLELIDIGEHQWENEDDPPEPLLILLTDGKANVEETNTDVIISKAKKLNNKENPIYTLAFGYDADFNFLRKLSLQNFGFTRLIYEAADATKQLKNFYQTVASPLISNVTFTYIPEQVNRIYHTKEEFPVFLKGSELVVAGKINTENIDEDTHIGDIVGVTATGAKTYPIVKHLTLQKQQNRLIGHMEKVWSYLTIQQLLDKTDSLDDEEDEQQTRKHALDLALQYGFVTPLTSLVVVKPDGTKSTVDPTEIKPETEEEFIYPSESSVTVSPRPEEDIDIRRFIEPVTQTDRTSTGAQEQMSTAEELLDRTDFRLAEEDSQKPDTQTDRTSSGLDKVFFPTSTEEHDTETRVGQTGQTARPQKVSMDSVVWVQQALKETSSIKHVTVGEHVYKLGMNKVNIGFGDCKVNSESGECHHLQHCALDVFQGNITQFLPYLCYIPGNFLGVCCPNYFL